MSYERLYATYPMLRTLPRTCRDLLQAAICPVHLAHEEVMVDVGAPCLWLPLVTRGTVKVFRQGESRDILLYRIGPGEGCVLSLCAMLGGIPFPARAVAEGEVEGYLLSEETFCDLSTRSPAFRDYIFALFTRHALTLLTLIEELAFQPLDQRLAAHLAAYALPTVELTHVQLANELGCAREVVSRHLKHLERHGLLQLERGRIHVLDAPALAEHARQLGDSSH